jgi:formamidopyrimidine-DNA glycosylase
MPELPEVETIVRQLAPELPGRVIRRVVVARPDLLDEGARAFHTALRGATILGVGRRAKIVVLSLSGPQVLAVGLGMTGRLLLDDSGSGEVPPHRGVSFLLDPTGVLHYADSRRFGRLRRLSVSAWEEREARLGPEPLERALTRAGFRDRLSGSRAPIRSWLLDQGRVAGVGNIYANEALFRAGIHPARPAGTLSDGQAADLLASLRSVLREAIRAHGTTLRDYRTARGRKGRFSFSLRVYGREGSPCPVCKTPVERIVFGNRSAFLCPRCQSGAS